MMHCERCNIDFPEGLRYCKWCGQALAPRLTTGPLNSCPSCFAAIESSWGFCKACGARLSEQTNEPLTANCPRCNAATEPGALNCTRCGEDLTRSLTSQVSRADSTMALAHCPTCGEQVDAGSMYCKACGSALYEDASPFGPSALLCATCNSYSPLGSTLCRVCGATLGEPARPAADDASGGPVAGRRHSSTLPDLDEHLPKDGSEPDTAGFGSDSQPSVDSESQTAIFSSTDVAQQAQVIESQKAQDETPTTAIPPRRAASTTVLPGVAGSKAEQSGSTQVIHKKRDTGSVEGEAKEAEKVEEAEDVKADSTESPFATRIDRPSGFFIGEQQTAAPVDARPEMSEPDSAAIINGESTIVLGSGMAAPTAFESDEGLITSGREAAAHDRVTTGDLDSTTGGLAEEKSTVQLPPSGQLEMVEVSHQPSEMAAQAMSEPVWTGEPEPPQAFPQAPAPQPEFQPATEIQPAPMPAKKSSAIIPIIVAVIVLAAAGGAVWWFMSGSKPASVSEQPASTNPPASQPSTPSTPSTPSATAAPEGMAYIPGGRYIFGRSNAAEIEGPEFSDQVTPFFIDTTEVTNARYKEFLDANPNHSPPTNWAGGTYPEGKDDYPVTGVTWQDAAAYAAWAGKRLPTEKEWEAAARSIEGRRYPWGDEWLADAANINVRSNARYDEKQYPAEIRPAGQYPQGASREGILDLIGNVWEWTASPMELYPGTRASLPPDVQQDSDRFRVIRGGAYDGDRSLDAAYRGYLEKGLSFPKVGFRCAKDAK